MKAFKKTELYLSVSLIAFFAAWYAIEQEGSSLFLGYFIVGGLHILGMLVHAAKGWFTGKGSKRYYYHWTMILLLILLPTGVPVFLLLYTAPLFALYYTWICWKEVQALELKELVHLK